MEQAGLVNVYVCQKCGGRTITKNRDAGTTPFMISCRVTRDGKPCDGAAESSFYRNRQDLKPDLLFIKPTDEELSAFIAKVRERHPELRTIDRDIQEHIRMGGLLDVPVTGADGS